MTKTATVYVKLMDEDIDVWRPVTAEHLDGDRYRLRDEAPLGEMWPFAAGDVVRCERRILSANAQREEVLVAYEKSK